MVQAISFVAHPTGYPQASDCHAGRAAPFYWKQDRKRYSRRDAIDIRGEFWRNRAGRRQVVDGLHGIDTTQADHWQGG